MRKNEKLAGRLHSSALRMLRGLRRHDTHSGIGPARLSALSVLVYAGPQALGQLASIEQVRPPTMTRIVAGLVEQGLARRVASPEDRRSTQIHATALGRRKLERARVARVGKLAEALDTLTPDQRSTLSDAAKILSELPPFLE